MAKVKLTTENSIVNAVGKMAFTGNVIPESWYKTVVSANGRVNLLAVNLLGEIVYWYRPMEVRDERSGDVTWVKKFADEEYLQKSYAQICEKYNVSTKQARDVVELAAEIFAPLRLSKEDIRAIVREAEYDIDRCMKAKAFFDAYRTPVGHATGLLISFVREDYPKQPRIPPAMNPFNSFSQQIYTPEMIDALEKELLSANDCPTVAAVQG